MQGNGNSSPTANGPMTQVTRDFTWTQTFGRRYARYGQQGFTLIELIAVFLLLSIMAAIAVSHSTDFGLEADLRGATEVVKGHLRYAQTKAMNSDVSWGINFAGSTYTLQNASSATAALPGEVPQDMTFASTVNPVMFENRWGSPGSATITVTVSKGGSSQTVTVTRNTGFIP